MVIIVHVAALSRGDKPAFCRSLIMVHLRTLLMCLEGPLSFYRMRVPRFAVTVIFTSAQLFALNVSII